MSSAEDWTCDTCGKPIKTGGLDADGRYTGADDPEKRRGRHAKCHRTLDETRQQVKGDLAKVHAALAEIRRRLR